MDITKHKMKSASSIFERSVLMCSLMKVTACRKTDLPIVLVNFCALSKMFIQNFDLKKPKVANCSSECSCLAHPKLRE